MDSNWGAGHVPGRSVVRDFSSFWFDCRPELFLWTHLPEEQKWQLVSEPISMTDYIKRKYYKSFFFESLYALGVDEESIANSLNEDIGIPEGYNHQYDLRIAVIHTPVGEYLKAGEEIEVELFVPDAGQAAFINNEKSFTGIEKTGALLLCSLHSIDIGYPRR